MSNEDDEKFKNKLTPEQYAVLRKKETEPPFSGKLLFNQKRGVYSCAACGNDLFSSEAKFESDCGWPSFDEALKAGSVKLSKDDSFGMARTEATCGKCGSHLGHLFENEPISHSKTGKRFCINSLSLNFQEGGKRKMVEK
jgi:methionine-R-sulfoxide reductase